MESSSNTTQYGAVQYPDGMTKSGSVSLSRRGSQEQGTRPSLASVSSINCEICRPAKCGRKTSGERFDERTPVNSQQFDARNKRPSGSNGSTNNNDDNGAQKSTQIVPVCLGQSHKADIEQSISEIIRSTQYLASGETDAEESAILDWARSCPCIGIFLALCASLFLASAGLLVKMTVSVHPIEVAMFRALFQLIIYTAIIMTRNRGSFHPARGEYLATAARAVLGGLSITCGYTALKMIPLGDATAIRFSLPIWTLIIGHLVLKESCYVINVFAVLVSIMGVTLIAKPSQCMQVLGWLTGSKVYETVVPVDLNIQRLEGCLIALCSSICLAVSYISIRMCRKTPAQVVIFWLSVVSILIGLVTLLVIGRLSMPDNWTDLAYMVLNGVCGALGQYCITMALKIEESGPISLARSFDIVVAFSYSALLLHEEIGITSIVGAILVSSSVVTVVLTRWFGPSLCFGSRKQKH